VVFLPTRAGILPAPVLVCALPCSIGDLYSLAVSSEDRLSRTPPPPDSRVEYGRDASQFVDVRSPAGKGPHPVVFFIHGGFWRAQYGLTHSRHLLPPLQQPGIGS